jgi:hypothetical protein
MRHRLKHLAQADRFISECQNRQREIIATAHESGAPTDLPESMLRATLFTSLGLLPWPQLAAAAIGTAAATYAIGTATLTVTATTTTPATPQWPAR